MENLLCGYGVSFTSSLADKLIEIMQLVRADGAREFAEKIKSEIEKYWYRSELDMGAENVNSLIDAVLAEMQKGAEQ